MRFTIRQNSAQARRRSMVSLTPLIDVVFILLIFFMLASSFSREQAIAMFTPGNTDVSADGGGGAALIRIASDGSLDLNGEPMDRVDLAKRVATWSVQEHPRRYLIQPGAGVSVQQTVGVIDLLKASGARSVSLTRKSL